MQILRYRSKQLRQAVYDIDKDARGMLPEKNTTDVLNDELAYSQELVSQISNLPEYGLMPNVCRKLHMLEEAIEDILARCASAVDSDARVGHKSKDDSFIGYKTHLAVSQEGIITAVTVTSGEKGDGGELAGLVEQSRSHGMVVEEVIGDAAYSGQENLELSQDPSKGFALTARLHPAIGKGTRAEGERWDFNKDAGMYICPAGHMAIKFYKVHPKGRYNNTIYNYVFDHTKCEHCIHRES